MPGYSAKACMNFLMKDFKIKLFKKTLNTLIQVIDEEWLALIFHHNT